MTKTYRLTGLCCANCAARMERLIEKIDTVEEVTLNFMTTKLIVEMQLNRPKKKLWQQLQKFPKKW